ncbi:MAG: TIGR03435 family protein [Terriglobales bacterium]
MHRPSRPARRIAAAAALLLVTGASAAAAQQPAPAFVAVSIKPDRDVSGVRGIHNAPGGIFGVASLEELIEMAYHVDPTHVVGAGGWIKAELFQIETRTSSRASFGEQETMLQPALAARFGLKFKWAVAQVSGYALVVAKDGPKLKPSAPGERDSMREDDDPAGIGYTAKASTVAELAAWLQWIVGNKPVLDQTGLTAKYDIAFKCAPPLGMSINGQIVTQPAGGAPSVFTAVKQALGLELKPVRVPLREFVIVSAHKPTPN